MKVPQVKKTITGKYRITLNKRQAEVLAMFLGTQSPISVFHTVNKYWANIPEDTRPPLMERHRGVDKEGWRTQDTMVVSHIYSGLIRFIDKSPKII